MFLSQEFREGLVRFWKLAPVQKLAATIVNFLPLYLVFPWHPAISIPALVLAVGSVLTWPASTPSRWSSRARSIVLFFVGLLWATLSPYFVLGGRLYLYDAKSLNPLDAKIIPLGDTRVLGHLLYLCDVVRPSRPIRAIARVFGSDVEDLERSPGQRQFAMVMPLSSALRFRILGAGISSYGEELIASYSGIALCWMDRHFRWRQGEDQPTLQDLANQLQTKIADYRNYLVVHVKDPRLEIGVLAGETPSSVRALPLLMNANSNDMTKPHKRQPSGDLAALLELIRIYLVEMISFMQAHADNSKIVQQRR